jgi:hypothetical protein
MTTANKTEYFTTLSGTKMYVEQYAEAPYFVKMWRYGFLYGDDRAVVEKDMLLSKPRKSQLINKY